MTISLRRVAAFLVLAVLTPAQAAKPRKVPPELDSTEQGDPEDLSSDPGFSPSKRPLRADSVPTSLDLSALPDLSLEKVESHLGNSDRRNLFRTSKAMAGGVRASDFHQSLAALHSASCPPSVLRALAPAAPSFSLESEEDSLTLAFSPGELHPLTTTCLGSLVQVFPMLFSHVHCLKIRWQDSYKLTSPDQLNHFLDHWPLLQALLDNPPSTLTTLDIQSTLVEGVTMGALKRLSVDLDDFSMPRSGPLASFLQAAAPRLDSLVLRNCKEDAAAQVIKETLRGSTLTELAIKGAWTSLADIWDRWDMTKLTHVEVTGPSLDNRRKEFWTKAICHGPLLSLHIEGAFTLARADLARAAECLAANPSLQRLVAPGLCIHLVWEKAPLDLTLPGFQTMAGYLNAVRNHPSLLEWSVPRLFNPTLVTKTIGTSGWVWETTASHAILTAIGFPRIRTVWWPLVMDWPECFPRVTTVVISGSFWSGKCPSSEIARPFPAKFHELRVVGLSKTHHFELQFFKTPAKTHVQTLVILLNSRWTPVTASHDPATVTALAWLWRRRLLVILDKTSIRSVNGLSVQKFEELLPHSFIR